MPTILEELKARVAAAQARHAAANQKFQATQAELQAAAGEFNIWNNALNIETREEAARAAEAAKDQIPITLEAAVEEALAPDPVSEQPIVLEDEEPVNKTNLVRDLLRANPTGLTVATIWTEFHQQAPKASRNYLYSVLKRLRDKKQIEQKRGKYMLKAKPTVTVDETFVGGATIVH
jgi:cell pole-organizing protein PopZ